ncbi:hypothetical protein BTA35_0202340 [Oceanospirillum linum]|uniref:23S rRNA (uracil(1939)-C(5))-methyltransferase RlmD n=1 Tax=Oceanospirillum linum TaxID=966 RepID=A0A1T1HGD9_OCELI|nr:hypothetical protein BTA35_0202340 [Oceanospirillum linum]
MVDKKGGYVPELVSELPIERLSHDGRGIARHKGKTVFVEGALAGEVVSIHITKTHRRFDEAVCEVVHSQSPDRVTPSCEYYQQCGGCGLQHLTLERQREVKQSALVDQLERFGKLTDIPVQAMLADAPWGYRRKARLGVKWSRQEELIIGFREKGSSHLVSIQHCAVLHPELSAIIPSLYQLIPELESRRTIGHLELAHSDEGCALVVRHLKALSHKDQMLWLNWAEEHSIQLYWQKDQADSLVKACLEKGKPVMLSGDDLPVLSYRHNDVTLTFQPNDFIQVNPAINQQMVNQALEWLQLKESDVVLDLFAGFGNFSLPLAKKVASVTGVEGAANLVRQARVNAKLNGIENAFFEAADLSQAFKGLSWAKTRYNVVLLDPPRTGAQTICEQMKSLGAKKVLYVSCNPSTLARDSAILAEQGFRLVKAGIMDMFPQTAHVESMALFERSGKKKKKQA